MISLWMVVLSLAVLEVSGQTSGQSQLLCQLNPQHCCVCWPNDLHGYCSTGRCTPDDYANECRTNDRFAAEHVLPDEWELMLNSRDYQNLLQDSNPVWTRYDADRDGRQFFQRGGICQYDLRACEYTRGPQDNWVFTQHIKYPPGIRTIGPTEIFLNTSYRFSQCTGNPACDNDFVTLYRFDTNGFEPNKRNDPANYVTPLFGPGTETTDSKLQQVGLSDVSIVRSFTISGTHTGFYLGIRDTGTCGQLKRMFLYYIPSCKKLQEGLVNYPEVVRPPAGSGPYTAEACCASNSRNTTTSRTIRAYSDGRCDRGVVCVCDPGYILDTRGTGCIACPAEMYRSVSDPQTNCLTCPMNTVNDIEAAPACPCVDGYFRDVQTNEGPDVDCTPPPSPVRNLRTIVFQTRDTSVTVTWTKPETPGRSDFYYTIEYSDPDSFGNFLPADPRNTRYINSAFTVTYRIPASGSGVSLRPDTDFTIRVTVHNGVSDQDIEREPLRRRELQVRTKEGLPSVPVVVQLIAGVVVWGLPAQPNGDITGYDVRFSDLFRSNPIIPKQPSETFHLVVDGNIAGLSPSNTRVQIRARTSVGPGVWSSPEPYTADVTCDDVPLLPYGNVDQSGNAIGSMVEYSCDAGFMLNGPSVRVCKGFADWTHAPPTCKVMLCEELSGIENGEVVYTSAQFGSVARYSCNEGYTLSGSVSRICRFPGQWSGVEPTCIILCDELSGIENGEVVYNSSWFGSVARYSCNKGYTLSGLVYRICRFTGQWSGVEPTCIQNCELLRDITNGNVDVSGVTLGSLAFYTCNEPYKLEGGANVRQCIRGTWTGHEPSCQPPPCPNSGEFFSSCASTCRPTCSNPSSTCFLCQPGCTCPQGMVLNVAQSHCVDPSECVTFELRGIPLSNSSTVTFSDIGEGNNGLIFRTDFTNCCKEQFIGVCYGPDGVVIPVRALGKELYHNRGVQLLRLNRKPGATTVPEGKYCCHVPVSESKNKVVCANIIV